MRLPWLGRPQGSPLRRITIRPTIQVADQHLLCHNREAWQRSGEQSLWQRAVAEVEQRLAAYMPVETDPRAVAEMERLIRSGMAGAAPLPAIPGLGGEIVSGGDGRRQRRFRR